MRLTLLVENNPKIEAFYVLNLYTWLGLSTVTIRTVEAALTWLESSSAECQLVIVRAVINKGPAAQEVVRFLREKNLPIPVIVIGPGEEVPGSSAHVANSLMLKNLIQFSARALNITAQDMNSLNVPDFFPIPISYFQSLKRSICPVYIQDPGDPSIFILWIDKLKSIAPDTITKLVAEGTKFLYVDKLDRLEFVNNVTSELVSQLEHKALSPEEQLSAGEKSFALLSRKILTLGVEQETIDLAQKALESIKKNVKNYPKIEQLLNRLLANKTTYVFKHTQLLTYVALHIVRNIDWGSPEQEEKIAFIAFFHDIAFENDELAEVKSNDDLKKASISAEDRVLVEKHAQLAADLVQRIPHAPMGADQIIRQHHGTLNGIGFSEHYGNNVSPMSIVFIVAEEFVRILIKYEDQKVEKSDLIRELRDVFPTSRFQKVIDLVQSLMP